MRTEVYSFFVPISDRENILLEQRSLGAEQLAGVCCFVSTVSFGDNSPLFIYNRESQPIVIIEQANERKYQNDFPYTFSLNGNIFYYIDTRFLEGIQLGCVMLGYDGHTSLGEGVIGSESESDGDDSDDDNDEELPPLVDLL